MMPRRVGRGLARREGGHGVRLVVQREIPEVVPGLGPSISVTAASMITATS